MEILGNVLEFLRIGLKYVVFIWLMWYGLSHLLHYNIPSKYQTRVISAVQSIAIGILLFD